MTHPDGTAGQRTEYTSAQCQHFNYPAGDPRVNALGFGAPALDLAALGYAVLPLRRGGKPPHETLGAQGGVHWATNDPRQVRYWWEVEDLAANIGVRTGQLPFPGRQVVVVDLTPRACADGPAIFRQFLAEHGLSLPAGLPVDRTPTGGYHLWLGWPVRWGPCPERPGLLGGVDIKGDGGYVAVPPSWLRVPSDDHDGHRPGVTPVPYMRESGCPCWLPDAPQWFADWIRTAPSAGPARTGSGGGGGDIDAEQVMAHGARSASATTTYYRLACSRYRRHGTSLEGAAEVLAEVRSAWLAGDTTGFTERELLVCVESARKFIEKQQAAERRAFVMWMGRP